MSSQQFMCLYELISEILQVSQNTRQGRTCKLKALHLAFMTLSYFKWAGKSDNIAFTFRLRNTHFETNVKTIVIHFAEKLYDLLVKNIKNYFTTENVCIQNIAFENFNSGNYACDVNVRFQQSTRPCGSHDEANHCYRLKHQLYGYKTECFVPATSYCIRSPPHVIGSVSSLDILRKELSWHRHS